MKILIKLSAILVFFFCPSIKGQQNQRPKLIVGVVIDQMRAEYLYRFQDYFIEDGFKKLIRDDATFEKVYEGRELSVFPYDL